MPTTAVSPEKADPEAAKLEEYVVCADAIMLQVGRKDVRRFERGARLRLKADDQRVKDFLAARVIVRAGDTTSPRATAKRVFRALGAEPDPIKLPAPTLAPADPS